MRVSKLAFESFKQSGSPDLEMWQGRCTGNTTGYILSFIGKCMQNPDTCFKVCHMEYFKQNRQVFNEIKHRVHENELLYFKFNHSDLSVVYKPFMEVRKVVTWEVINADRD